MWIDPQSGRLYNTCIRKYAPSPLWSTGSRTEDSVAKWAHTMQYIISLFFPFPVC